VVSGYLMLATIAPLELDPLAAKDERSWGQAGRVPCAGVSMFLAEGTPDMVW
jgi:hypothetical protein